MIKTQEIDGKCTLPISVFHSYEGPYILCPNDCYMSLSEPTALSKHA